MCSRTSVAILAWAGASLLLSSCSQFEPFQRAGTWHETDTPMQNIQAELVNPADFYHGHGDTIMTGTIAEDAIGSGLNGLAKSGASGGSAGSGAAGSGASGGATGLASGSTGGGGIAP